MAVILFDTPARARLYPITYTKAIAGIRFGIFSIRERWQRLMNEDVFVQTADYLQSLYAALPGGVNTWINACVIPSQKLADRIKALQPGDVLENDNGIIACVAAANRIDEVIDHSAMNFTMGVEAGWLLYPHQMIQWNDAMIRFDLELIRKHHTSKQLSSTNILLGEENIYVEEGVSAECTIINATAGPVYIGAGANLMEGCLIKGPVSIGANAVVKMGAKVYGATSIGPGCTAGGEIKNVVMQAFSNKAHDGYLGDSVIGEWCNFGAGASNSNVKNTAGDVLHWNVYDKAFVNAGNKCGLITGDYTRVAINSSINTGSVYGVSCNVFGEGLLPTRLRCFSWGVTGEGYTVEKAIKHINQWKNFKQQTLSEAEESVLTYIFDNFITE